MADGNVNQVGTYTPKQTPTSNVAHIWMTTDSSFQTRREIITHYTHILYKVLFTDNILDFKRSGTRDWVALVSLAMNKGAIGEKERSVGEEG
jgi:hypothetical protein